MPLASSMSKIGCKCLSVKLISLSYLSISFLPKILADFWFM